MKYILESSLEGLNVLPMDDNQLQKALKVDAPDFEDVLQYECAKAGNCDLIVTSNIKHFKFSDIEVMSTADFATKFSKRI